MGLFPRWTGWVFGVAAGMPGYVFSWTARHLLLCSSWNGKGAPCLEALRERCRSKTNHPDCWVSPARVFALWSLCPGPQRYKSLFICNCGEWLQIALCLLWKQYKNMFLIMEPLYCFFFFFASPSPLFFFFFPPPSLFAEVIAGWLRIWAGRERQKNGCYSHQRSRKLHAWRAGRG